MSSIGAVEYECGDEKKKGTLSYFKTIYVPGLVQYFAPS
jgi:hypothetical protein